MTAIGPEDMWAERLIEENIDNQDRRRTNDENSFQDELPTLHIGETKMTPVDIDNSRSRPIRGGTGPVTTECESSR